MTHPKDKDVREKLVVRGVESLSDAELLSILLGDGVGAKSALDMAVEALAATKPDGEENSLPTLARLDIGALRLAGGMGVRRAAAVAAAFETGRRIARAQATEHETITSDRDAMRVFGPLLAGLPHEEFWAAYLSSSGRIIEKARVSQGGVSGTVVDYKIIVKRAVELLSTSIIVVHNHPSGAAVPSEEDRTLTARLQNAAALFDITLLDHIIVAREGHFSFRKENLLA